MSAFSRQHHERHTNIHTLQITCHREKCTLVTKRIFLTCSSLTLVSSTDVQLFTKLN